MTQHWLRSREKQNIFKDDMWWKMGSYDYIIPRRRRNIYARTWDAYAADALIFMGATIKWARIGVHRGWLEPTTFLRFQKLKTWECADPAEKEARASTLKAKSWRSARGQVLDLQTRWRGGFQWASDMTEEWGLLGAFTSNSKRSGIGRRSDLRPRSIRLRQANLLRQKDEFPA